MVNRALRSRSFRHKKVKTPGGIVVIHHEKRKPKRAHCANCGAVLSGVPRLRPTMMQNIAKSQRRPERPYGGVLCTRCSRSLIKQKAKSL